MKIEQRAKTAAKEVELGTRKISRMNFSRIVALPKVFVRNSPYGEVKRVKIIMLQDGSLKLIPIHEQNELDPYAEFIS